MHSTQVDVNVDHGPQYMQNSGCTAHSAGGRAMPVVAASIPTICWSLLPPTLWVPVSVIPTCVGTLWAPWGLMVKMETRHPIEGPFGLEFLAFVIIAELWWFEVARPGNLVSNFCVLFGKMFPFKLSLLRRLRPKSFRASPHKITFGSHCSRFHSNLFTFGGVIVESVKTVFAP